MRVPVDLWPVETMPSCSARGKNCGRPTTYRLQYSIFDEQPNLYAGLRTSRRGRAR
jgi:hypothetical protein